LSICVFEQQGQQPRQQGHRAQGALLARASDRHQCRRRQCAGPQDDLRSESQNTKDYENTCAVADTLCSRSSNRLTLSIESGFSRRQSGFQLAKKNRCYTTFTWWSPKSLHCCCCLGTCGSWATRINPFPRFGSACLGSGSWPPVHRSVRPLHDYCCASPARGRRSAPGKRRKKLRDITRTAVFAVREDREFREAASLGSRL
jgi:hypothetical protein